MKIHTTVVTMLFTALAILTLISCSSDIEEEEGGILIEMGEDGVTVTTTVDGVTTVHKEEAPGTAPPEVEPPEPDWADNIITITVGRFRTKHEMVEEFRKRQAEGMRLNNDLANWIDSPKFREGTFWEEFRITPPEQRYTVDITLISLEDTGLEVPATIAEIRDRIREMGYEPITLEETYEIRLQLKDQPNWGPWSNFRSLQTKEEADRTFDGIESSERIYREGETQGMRCALYSTKKGGIRPNNDLLLVSDERFRTHHGHQEVNNIQFACAIPGSRQGVNK